jgi:hypothetical protein
MSLQSATPIVFRRAAFFFRVANSSSWIGTVSHTVARYCESSLRSAAACPIACVARSPGSRDRAAASVAAETAA